MRECVKKARRAVSGFLLIIVGTAPLPSGLQASLHDDKHTLMLHMADETVRTED
jgi:hypothetical protein